MIRRTWLGKKLTRETQWWKQKLKKRFLLKKVMNNFVRVKREDSRLPYEDISRTDFIDIRKDLNKKEYAPIGYMQSDLHGGQNRHSALSFALIRRLPYIEWRKVGNE